MANKYNISSLIPEEDKKELYDISGLIPDEPKKKESGDLGFGEETIISDIAEETDREAPEVEAAKKPEEPEEGTGELSFQEESKDAAPNFMGLFDKKEKIDRVQSMGVSLDFYEQIATSASQAERPIDFIFEANHLSKRLESLPVHFPELADDVERLNSEFEKHRCYSRRDRGIRA